MGVSDLCPLMFAVGVDVQRRKPSFRFLYFWVHDVQFLPSVRATWQSFPQVSPIVSFGLNLRALKPVLRRLGHHIGAIQKSVREARARMLAAQALLFNILILYLLKRRSVSPLVTFGCGMRRWRRLCVINPEFSGLSLGDQNIAFFSS